jgi:hypothetical protein
VGFDEVLDRVYILTEEYVKTMKTANPEDLGLDRRSAHKLFVSPYCIAVREGGDKTLQYYGGFEYVNKNCRKPLGGYVFYLADDDRVFGHISEIFDFSDILD